MRRFIDGLAVEILVTDTVMVTSWGYGARLIDTNLKRPVIRFNRTRVVILDASNEERAMRPIELTVLRRDGASGFEGNKDR
jgi:hypothetical protein